MDKNFPRYVQQAVFHSHFVTHSLGLEAELLCSNHMTLVPYSIPVRIIMKVCITKDDEQYLKNSAREPSSPSILLSFYLSQTSRK